MKVRSLQLLLLAVSAGLFLNCASPKKMRVFIKMMPAQEEHFKSRVVPKFEKEKNVKVEVTSLDNIADLPKAIKEADATGGVHLVKVPFEMTRILTSQDLILPLDSIVTPQEINQLKTEYFLMDLVRINKMYYYFPRKFETRMLLYLKSHVREAVQNWEQYKDEINSVLKKHNGFGLPHEYLLESNPGEWDYFDIFVVGYYWKSKEIGGKKTPRIAHRGKKYSGTSLRIMDRAYQLGGSPEDILKGTGAPIADAFMWETLYARENIYNPRMYQEEWSGSDIWKGFQSGDVFLSFMTQIDAFFIHGAGTDAMPGFLENPEDMGVAVMPKAVSLNLDENGAPLREGSRGITTGGWWWGIPKNTPDPKLSFELAHYITNTENQIEGCSGFGMVPVRQDMLSELGLMFGGGWISDVFHVASQQLVENRFTVIPLIDEYNEVGNIYLDAFFDIVAEGNIGGDKVDFNKIKGILDEKYVPKFKAVLKKKYPGEKKSSKTKTQMNEEFKPLNENLE